MINVPRHAKSCPTVSDRQNIANTYVVASCLLISRSCDRRGKSFSSSHVMVWLGRDLNMGLWSA